VSDAYRQNSDDKRSAKVTPVRILRRIAEMMPLRFVFSLPFILQFIIAMFLIVFLLFRGGQDAVNALLTDMRQDVLERVHEKLRYHMQEPLRFNRLNVDAWNGDLFSLADPALRERYFVSHIDVFPEAAMSFVGLPDGSFYGARRKASGEIQVVRNDRSTGGDSWYYKVSKQGEGIEREEVFPRFDPRTRPWYEAAQRAGKPVFSGVYRHFVFLEPTITAAYPVFDARGQLVAVFGVDYLLSWLGNTLRGMPVGPSGQVFITDPDGYIVAASALKDPFEQRDGRMERIRATDCNNPVLKAAAELAAKSKADSYEVDVDGHSYLVDVRFFRESGIEWKIYVVLAQEDFIGGIRTAVQKTMVVMLLIVGIVFFLAIWTSSWVTQPILRLNAAARELAEGRLRPVPDTERHDELGQLSRSFNRMARQLTDLVTHLEVRVAERTRDLAEKTHQEQCLRETLHRELIKAGRAQRAMLPENIDDQRLRLQILYEPFMMVSGDFCGYHWMNDDTVLFGYIIDATGHDTATALQTAAINVMIQEAAHALLPLSERLATLNRRVTDYFGDDVMVAVFCFELDLARSELRYAAAGVTEFFADAAAMQGRIRTPGLFLGVSDHLNVEVHVVPVCAGDRFCFYSDGIADYLNGEQELPLGDSFARLVDAVHDAAAGGVQRDDVTALCIEVVDLHKLSK
jgi:serine phosphatase RsbU (regulator of sigma subunit)/catechol 2,3-dioxygenase-like lactoylglutathione lyase family enzyme